MGHRERRARRQEWLEQERDALERARAERWAHNEPRRAQRHAMWHDARPVLRIMMVLMALALCGAIAF
jgi:hypothetical protein